MDDVLSMMLAASGPAKPATDGGTTTPADPWAVTGPGPDPWASLAGRDALARWGVNDPEPHADEGTRTPGDATDAEPMAKTMPPGEREQAAARLMIGVGKPYDPSMNGKRINANGYGLRQLEYACAHAIRLADGHEERRQPILLALLKGQWCAARSAWGSIIPDVPGLQAGTPDATHLLAWMDTPMCRDADGVQRLMIDMDPLLAPGASDTLEQTITRIGEASRLAANALTMTRNLLN